MQQRTRTLFLIGLAAVLLTLLAASLHDVVLKPGQPLNLDFQWGPSTGAAPRQQLEFPGWLPAAVAVVLVLAAIGIIISPSLRRDLLHNLPTYLLLVIGVFLLREAVMQQPLPRVETSAPAAAPAPQLGTLPPQSIPELVRHPPEWLVTALTLVLVGVLLAIAWLILRQVRRPRKDSDPLDELVAEARTVLADIQAGADLRDTISRCYAEMVRLINLRRGVTRDISMTPREFELRLAASGLGEAHIQRLTRLFERVRYGPHTLSLAEEQEAEACLRAIVEAYQGH